MSRPRIYDYKAIVVKYHEGVPVKEICEEFGCTNKTIQNAVMAFGGVLSRNTKICKLVVNDLLAKKPMKPSDLAKELMREPKTVRNFLNANGYPFKVVDKRGTKLYSLPKKAVKK